MPIRLQDVLKHSTLTPADPVIRAAAAIAAQTQLRWIHSSEVLDIAPLLGGGELLLTGGQALVSATDKRRIGYIWELAERGVAALAIETGTELASIPSSMVAAAEAAGLPLIELRKVVPFVGVMEAINSLLVSESAAHLQQADQASHAMAVELAHGGSLDRILAVLADATGSEVELTSTAGAPLASALPADHAEEPEPGASIEAAPDRARIIQVDVSVRGIPSARLTLHALAGADVNLARIAGNRSVDILALALLQRMPPGLKEMAGAALIRAVDSGTQNWRLQQLAPAAGIPLAAQLVAVVVRSPGSRQPRMAVEHLLERVGHHSASYADNAELLALAVLRPGKTQEDRDAILAGLQSLALPEGTVSAVGPVATGISAAPWSLTEARLTLDLAAGAEPLKAGPLRAGPGQSGVVLDADAFAVERLAFHSLDDTQRTDYVSQQLGALLVHDAQRNSALVETLRVWLDSGCNTAQAARELHLERQSMHQRLQRIFSLCGGDPRGTGRLAALHLAARLAAL
ncbi:helix-turn-helix domain-containing protein [Pseudarthrobacter raffinosi]|uniref:helix-turn-helix domain-containing protein n=1 Tax=Pseudarthrobacter raffinosi TaxID=2953651 RepID=UPI00208F8A7A|nr:MULTISPECIES: PucR family transcriptional regulator [unclassified Pseudarthrobacter]MCO4251309.1 PucR family transcriptional regulator ligand-binding domain-containing protein [Pseudarthrobacter sp. MDT3-9]MCO4264907.1 PucR family transcriptional regulator ligand-binding domain-containing protein [Pseudarthrobacter sp. MDT3-26]